MRKIISIIVIVLVIVAVGVASYYYFIYNGIDPETGEKVSFKEFLPFGSGSDREPGNGTESENEGSGIVETETEGNITRPAAALPAFHKIGEDPVAGYASFSATSTVPIRYVDRATGHVHEYDLITGTDEKISNTTVPKIRQTAWLSGARSLVMRYLSAEGEIESFYGSLVTSTTTGTSMELKGGFLPRGLDQVVAVPGTGKIFSLTTAADGANGFVSDLDGGNRTLVFKSQVTEWLAEPLNSDTMVLTTKPASYAQGFSYLLNLKTGRLTSVVGGKNGLMVRVSPKADRAVYSEATQKGIALKLYDAKTDSSRDIGLSTLADKCAWNKAGTTVYCAGPINVLGPDHVDLWYQGVSSEPDSLWSINGETGALRLIMTVSDEKQAFDAKSLSLDGTEKHLLFINKRDLGLWTYRLPVAQPQGTTTATTTPRT